MKSKVLSLAMTVFLSLAFVMLYPATTGAQERARFRVTITGFVVNHETFDDALQRDGRAMRFLRWLTRRRFGRQTEFLAPCKIARP